MRDATNEVGPIPIPPTHETTRHALAHRSPDTDRIAELEFENARLQRLVAELVLKNEKLRKFD